MLLVEGIWLADFWLVSVSSTVVCLLVAEKWEKNNRKKDLAIEEELLEAA